MRPARGRFAPSPTGALHIGSARTALVAWARTRRQKGSFLLRIEDIDGARKIDAGTQAILDDLAWLGLDWDETPVVQSERTQLYERALELLALHHFIYPCTCTRRDVEAASSAPHGDEGPIYPGTCRNGNSDKNKKPTLRFALEKARRQWPMDSYVDAILGTTTLHAAGDFVVRRTDGYFAYHFACTFDDRAMRISEVVRGADLQQATLQQTLLWQALDASEGNRIPLPTYAHVPLVLNPVGERMAKRDFSLTLSSIRKSGMRAEQLIERLVVSLMPENVRVPKMKIADVPHFLSQHKMKAQAHRWTLG